MGFEEVKQNTNAMRMKMAEASIRSPLDAAKLILESASEMRQGREEGKQNADQERRLRDAGIFSGLVALKAGGKLGRQDLIAGLGRIQTNQGAQEVAGLLAKIEAEEENEASASAMATEFGIPYVKGMTPQQVISMKGKKDADAKVVAGIAGLKNLAKALNPELPDGGFVLGDSEDSIRARYLATLNAATNGKNPLDMTPEEISAIPDYKMREKVWHARNVATDAQWRMEQAKAKADREAGARVGFSELDNTLKETDPEMRIAKIIGVDTGGDPILLARKDKMLRDAQAEAKKAAASDAVERLSAIPLEDLDSLRKFPVNDSATLNMVNSRINLALRMNKAPVASKNVISSLSSAQNTNKKNFEQWMVSNGFVDYKKRPDYNRLRTELSIPRTMDVDGPEVFKKWITMQDRYQTFIDNDSKISEDLSRAIEVLPEATSSETKGGGDPNKVSAPVENQAVVTLPDGKGLVGYIGGESGTDILYMDAGTAPPAGFKPYNAGGAGPRATALANPATPGAPAAPRTTAAGAVLGDREAKLGEPKILGDREAKLGDPKRVEEQGSRLSELRKKVADGSATKAELDEYESLTDSKR